MDLGEMPINAKVFHVITDAAHVLRYGHGEAALQIDTNRKNILATMRHFDSVDVAELAEHLDVELETIKARFAELLDEGLVEVVEGDCRALTDAGWKVADEISDTVMRISNAFIDAIDDDQKQQLIDIVETMVDAWYK